MSERVSIKALLEGVEVEWKSLGEVVTISNTGVDKKIKPNEKKVRLLNFVDVFKHQYISNIIPTMIVTASDKKIIDCNIKEGDVFITPSSEVIDEIGFSAMVTEDIKDAVYSYHIMRLRINNKKVLSPDFLNYIFSSNDIRKQIRKKSQGITRFGLTQPNWKSLKIPIPPLKIQSEIVRILDNFTELTAELTAELSARKKQYQFYRDKLLSFEDGEVEWKTFKDVTLPTRNIKWKDTKHTYRYIDLTSVSRENNLIIKTFEITANNAPSRAKKLVVKDDVIFATTRPAQQRFCLINDEYSGEIASTGYCVLRAKSNKVLPKWIYYHVSSSDFKNYLEENQSGSAYPAISDAKLKEFKIPIPPLAEQQKIVSILDKFDTLTNSISEGLPKEIELRQKQYEYYRELLLTFPKESLS